MSETPSVRSDSIIRTNPTLGSSSFFQPSDWSPNWCGPDSDLGSASPVLISPTLMFTAGKHGGGFLLNPTNLGGTNGQLYPARTPYVQADVCLGQNSDATFRLFDYGRKRELHENSAIAVSDAGPMQVQSGSRRLTGVRTALVASPHFIFERIDLPANSNWALNADRETWLLVIEGQARIGLTNMTVGDAAFAEADRAGIDVGLNGMSALLAYPGPDPVVALLEDSGEHMTKSTGISAAHPSKPEAIVGMQT